MSLGVAVDQHLAMVAGCDNKWVRKENKMPIYVSAKTYAPPPEGLHGAVCVDVIDLGIVDTPFGPKHKVRIVWEIDKRRDDGRPIMVAKTYTMSLHEKAGLHKDLRAWRGRPFSPEELKAFDLERLIGIPCQVVNNYRLEGGSFVGLSITNRLSSCTGSPSCSAMYF